jgi:hypothetical protein
MRGVLTVIARLRLAPLVSLLFLRDATRNARESVNIKTHRCRDFCLSCAQDYRPGYGGDQQHIWQAALSEQAVVFTTHPGSYGDGSVSYWTGSGVLPRAVLVDRAVICSYRIHARPAIYHRNRLFFSHAWFPTAAFDEVRRHGRWVFGRSGTGFVGLFCSRSTEWRHFSEALEAVDRSTASEPGLSPPPNELVAWGRRMVWVCEVGTARDGDFDVFCAGLAARHIVIRGNRVRYETRSGARLRMRWRGVVRLGQHVVQSRNYPRYESPFVSMEFGGGHAVVACGGVRHPIDWQNGS